MTIAANAPTVGQPVADDVSWRQLRTGLWAARRDGHHLGTVEQGRRWIASDADSEAIGVYRTFREAQSAVAGPRTVRRPARRSSPLVGPLGIVAFVAAAAISAAGWALGAFLF